MNKMMKIAAFACAGVLMLSGCSTNNDEADQSKNGNANATETTPPQNNSAATNDSMDAMMNYLNGAGISVSDRKSIDAMDFAAYEGASFTYNGNTGYLYRLKSNDESMKALLDSAKKTGTAKVSIDGKEQEYSASVNGDYLFLYTKDADMQDFVTAMGNYVPGATTTTPNQGGSNTTAPTNGTQSPTNPQNSGGTSGQPTQSEPSNSQETPPSTSPETED